MSPVQLPVFELTFVPLGSMEPEHYAIEQEKCAAERYYANQRIRQHCEFADAAAPSGRQAYQLRTFLPAR